MTINRGPQTSFDNTTYQSLQQTGDWTRYQIVLDVPDDAVAIQFGIIARGGVTWLDDLQLEIVGLEVPITTYDRRVYRQPLMQPPFPKNYRFPGEPLNLDFEQ
jgi:hypothetical protein